MKKSQLTQFALAAFLAAANIANASGDDDKETSHPGEGVLLAAGCAAHGCGASTGNRASCGANAGSRGGCNATTGNRGFSYYNYSDPNQPQNRPYTTTYNPNAPEATRSAVRRDENQPATGSWWTTTREDRDTRPQPQQQTSGSWWSTTKEDRDTTRPQQQQAQTRTQTGSWWTTEKDREAERNPQDASGSWWNRSQDTTRNPSYNR